MRTRRNFITIVISGFVTILLLIWNRLTLVHIRSLKTKQTELPFDKTSPVSFYEDYIVFVRNGSPKVFSSHCTHLGCSIKKMEDGKLVCPCHGSEYNTDGIPVKGPSYTPLKQVEFELSENGKTIHINN